jgi:hypothetical protein
MAVWRGLSTERQQPTGRPDVAHALFPRQERSLIRTTHIWALSTAAVAILTLASGAAAQAPAPAVLSSLEVQQPVKRAEPADHARLAAHFAELSDRYVAEAGRHTGTRIVSAAARRDRLASLSRDEAKEATAAAEVHRQLAGVGP